jgi:hypothetical protein
MRNLRSLLALCFAIGYVITDNKTCPRYTCQKGSDNICAMDVATTAYNNVTLSQVCNTTSYCGVAEPKWATLAYVNNSTNYTCTSFPAPKTVRFPGEDCTVNDDCLKTPNDDTTGNCTNKVCTGKNETQDCTQNAVCLKGLFCDTDKCKKQKTQGESCATSYDCINSLLCHNGTCSIAPYSLDVNTVISSNDTLQKEKCKYGLTSYKNATDLSTLACTSYNQNDAGDTNGFATCNLGVKCNYTDVVQKVTINQNCGCGYNADGKGWCPLGTDKSN